MNSYRGGHSVIIDDIVYFFLLKWSDDHFTLCISVLKDTFYAILVYVLVVNWGRSYWLQFDNV